MKMEQQARQQTTTTNTQTDNIISRSSIVWYRNNQCLLLLSAMMKLKRTCLAFLPLTNKSCNKYWTTTKNTIRASTSSTGTGAGTGTTYSTTSHEHPYLDSSNKYLREMQSNDLPMSEPGLDPITNRFHQPIVYHPNYSFKSWPTSHTFPMSKFYHTAQTLLEKQPHLPRPLVRSINDFYIPLNAQSIPEAWISQPTGPIDAQFLHSFLSATLTYEQRRMIGFRDLCSVPELITRTLLEVSGTILSSNLAYKYGLATNVAGGTHHAHSTMGAGYTILNDLAIASNYVMDEKLNGGSIKGVKKVLVIDCDVHQGDGTAKFNLFQNNDDNNDERELITLSLHCQSNYPSLKANSTYDIGLPDNMSDDEYFDILVKSVNHAIDEKQPDFVFYDAGVDIYEHDVLGRLDITEDGIRKRDRWVIERCVDGGIPVVGVIGGGYDKDVKALGRRHAILHEEAAYVWRKHNLWSKS